LGRPLPTARGARRISSSIESRIPEPLDRPDGLEVEAGEAYAAVDATRQ
jgi:hypothetical protein